MLTRVLTYHITTGQVDPLFDRLPREIGTLQGQTLFIGANGAGARVNRSSVTCCAVRVCNGIVCLIDGVLQPQYR